MRKNINSDDLAVANATLLTTLIEHLVEKGLMSADDRQAVYENSIDRLRDHNRIANTKAALFLEAAISGA